MGYLLDAISARNGIVVGSMLAVPPLFATAFPPQLVTDCRCRHRRRIFCPSSERSSGRATVWQCAESTRYYCARDVNIDFACKGNSQCRRFWLSLAGLPSRTLYPAAAASPLALIPFNIIMTANGVMGFGNSCNATSRPVPLCLSSPWHTRLELILTVAGTMTLPPMTSLMISESLGLVSPIDCCCFWPG